MVEALLEQIKKDMKYKDAESIVDRVVYDAGLVFERLEGAGLIHGNGHHFAQNLAMLAKEIMEEHWIGPKDDV